MEVLRAHILDLAGLVAVPHLARHPPAQSLPLEEGGLHDLTHTVHTVLDEVHEIFERMCVPLQAHILNKVLEGPLPGELCERDGVLWASAGSCGAGAGAGWSGDWWRSVIVRW